MVVGKINIIAEATSLSDPHMYDIRDVRAVAKRNAKLYSYAPHAIYIKSLRHRSNHHIFENSFSGREMHQAECGSVSLTSIEREHD